MEADEHLRRLEQERRELMQNQGSRRAAISTLEDQCETLHSQLRIATTDLNQQKIVNDQLKQLQDQTDRALADVQAQLTQEESELYNAKEKIRGLESERRNMDQEIAALRNDIVVLKGTLSEVDTAKDGMLVSCQKLMLCESSWLCLGIEVISLIIVVVSRLEWR